MLSEGGRGKKGVDGQETGVEIGDGVGGEGRGLAAKDGGVRRKPSALLKAGTRLG